MNRKQRRANASNKRPAQSGVTLATQNTPAAELTPLRRGEALQRIGRYEEALASYALAIEQARAFKNEEELTTALLNSGALLLQLSRRLEALPLLHEAVQRDAGPGAKMLFAACISCIRFATARPEVKPILTQAMLERWIPPADLARVSTGLLLNEKPYIESLQLLTQPKWEAQFLHHPAPRMAAQDGLLHAVMTTTLITDKPVELLLTGYRRAMLLHPPTVKDSYMALVVALAHQGFANEYAFALEADETEALAALEKRLTNAVDSDGIIEPFEVALLAAYTPLHTLAIGEALLKRRWPDSMNLLFTRQLREPMQEAEILPTIPSLTSIDDTVSNAVRQQYEEHPYPRWLEMSAPQKPCGLIAEWIHTFFPDAPKSTSNHPAMLRILVAGCGTGQQSVGAARRFASSELLAVDLSKASLAYAIRKTNEAGIANVQYAHADILKLGTLDKRFDLVECAGVLHHMQDPFAGLKVLHQLTEPGGYMLLALYSEHARHDLAPVRAYAQELGISRTNEDLRRFRQACMALPPTHPAAHIVTWRDFYSLSMLRDLVFHVQETRYTLPRLKSELAALNLTFCGFNAIPEIYAGFRKHFGDKANLLSLDQWDEYEHANPKTFIGMYQFLVRKAA